jgi:thiamine-phosphate pyrophosphorylase
MASRPLIALIGDAARAGVDLIQIRERDLSDRALVALTREAIAAVHGTAARILVNDRPDIALAAGAAGVHLRGDSSPASGVRTMAPGGFVIGRSVHTEDEAAAAELEGGCDYLMFGTVFPSTSKPPNHRSAGLDALGRACSRVRLPVLAIGGLTVERGAAVAAAGAAGIAAIGLFVESHDLSVAVRSLRAAFDSRS